MNLLLVAPEELDARGCARLRDARAQHVRGVLGKGAGDELRVGIMGGMLGVGIIERANDEEIVVRCVCDQPPPTKRPIDLVIALPRPPVLRRVLAHATTMGVRRIVLLHTARVEKSYWQTPSLGADEVRVQVEEGLSQAMDTVPPLIEQRRRFRPFVEDELRHARTDRVLFAHPGAQQRCPVDVEDSVTLVVGPEGGFVPFEVELLAAAGATAVGLGPRILRVETAVIALLGRLGG